MTEFVILEYNYNFSIQPICIIAYMYGLEYTHTDAHTPILRESPQPKVLLTQRNLAHSTHTHTHTHTRTHTQTERQITHSQSINEITI